MPTYPLIEGILRLNGGAGDNTSEVPFLEQDRKTPAEVMILVRLHKGGTPEASEEEVLFGPKWTGDVEMDEDDLRGHLISLYGQYTVETLFPGPLPTTTHYPDCRDEWLARHGKAPKAAEGATAPTEVGKLRQEYFRRFQKNASPSWGAEELRARLDGQTEAA